MSIYKKGLLVFSLMLFGLILAINYFQPYTADEYNYSLISGTIDQRVESIIDILNSQWNLFFTWTGRNPVHFVLQFLLWLGKDIFNIINALMFIALIFIVLLFTRLTKFDKKEDLFSILLILFLVWFGVPAFGETIIWEAGAINYLWVAVVSLLFLLPYRYLLENKQLLKDDRRSLIMMVILGLIAGWSQENQAIVNVVFLISLSIYFWFVAKIRNYPKWYIGGLISLIVGAGFLFIAPGNYNRSTSLDNKLTIKEMFQNFSYGLKLVIIEQRYLLAILGLIAITFLLLVLFRDNLIKNKKTELLAAIFLLLGGLASILAMFVSPAFPPRSSFASAITFIITITILLNNKTIWLLNKKLLNIPIFLMSLFLLNSITFNYHQYYQLNKEHQQRIELIKTQVEKGNLNVKIPFYQDVKFNIHMFGWDITPDKSHYYNTIMTRYFGLNSLKGVYGSYLNSSSSLQINFKDSLKTNTYSVYYDIGKGYNNRHMYGEFIQEDEFITQFVSPIPEKNINNLKISLGPGKYFINSIEINMNNRTFTLTGNEIINNFIPSDGVTEYVAKENYVIVNVLEEGAFLEKLGFKEIEFLDSRG